MLNQDGAKYLSRLVNRLGRYVKMALASYNAGSGAVKKFRGIPPYAETRVYGRKILANYDDEYISR